MICYNCITEMKRAKKRLGIFGGMKTVWVCSECGYIETDKSNYIEGKEIDSIKEMKSRINDNKLNQYNEGE